MSRARECFGAGGLSPMNLETINLYADILSKSVASIAVIIGGIWTYRDCCEILFFVIPAKAGIQNVLISIDL